MADATDLGTYIFKSNPYTLKKAAADPLPTQMDPVMGEIEKDAYHGEWEFADRKYRIGSSLLIPYTYTDNYGTKVRKYMLVGFVGAGGQ